MVRNYTKYYTPIKVARLLINQCNIETPTQAIDICAGSWNLLNEAKKNGPA